MRRLACIIAVAIVLIIAMGALFEQPKHVPHQDITMEVTHG